MSECLFHVGSTSFCGNNVDSTSVWPVGSLCCYSLNSSPALSSVTSVHRFLKNNYLSRLLFNVQGEEKEFLQVKKYIFWDPYLTPFFCVGTKLPPYFHRFFKTGDTCGGRSESLLFMKVVCWPNRSGATAKWLGVALGLYTRCLML